MERLKELISQLKEQFDGKAGPSQMLQTTQLLEAELRLLASQPVPARAVPTKIAVMMPSAAKIVVASLPAQPEVSHKVFNPSDISAAGNIPAATANGAPVSVSGSVPAPVANATPASVTGSVSAPVNNATPASIATGTPASIATNTPAAVANGTPASLNGAPAAINGVPPALNGVPASLNGAPAALNGVPAAVANGIPAPGRAKEPERGTWPFDPLAEKPTDRFTLSQKTREINDIIGGGNGSSLNEKLKSDVVELKSALNDIPIRDLRKAIGVNDRYVFISQLFRGDEVMYERSIKTINGFHILPEAEYWMERELKVKLGWDENREATRHFYQLVKRRFS